MLCFFLFWLELTQWITCKEYFVEFFCLQYISWIFWMWGDGQVMIEDIKMVGQLGVQGVAIGVLTEDNKINVEQVLKKNTPPAAGLKI
jgi:hypothetical protein